MNNIPQIKLNRVAKEDTAVVLMIDGDVESAITQSRGEDVIELVNLLLADYYGRVRYRTDFLNWGLGDRDD